jgi:hypothetical protein
MIGRLVHEASSACEGDHCFMHSRDEPGPGFLPCTECCHLFRTRFHLRLRHVFAGFQSWWCCRRSPVVDRSVLPKLRHAFLGWFGPIYSCPFCASDF